MKMLRIACAVPVIVAAAFAVSATAQNVGDWVLAPWQNSGLYFPGTVAARNGQQVTIQFDDGTREVRLARELRPFNWQRGTQIACRWTDNNWYRATIQRMDGNGYTLRIRYDDDGTVEETNTGKCRSL